MKDGEVFFVGKDVAEVLGYTNPSKSINDHCKSLKTLKSNDSLLLGFDIPPRGLLVIPERDVYRLIMRSKLPSAEKFEEWVVGTVLPAIRKTGGYIQGEENVETEEELIYRAMEVMQKKIAAMKPKADYHDTWMTAEGSYTTTEVAKKLGISAMKLNKFLRAQGIKFKGKDVPKAGYESWFKMIDRTIKDQFGVDHVVSQCKVSPEGVKSIVELYENMH
jgi:prophage antirepressor-like protein